MDTDQGTTITSDTPDLGTIESALAILELILPVARHLRERAREIADRLLGTLPEEPKDPKSPEPEPLPPHVLGRLLNASDDLRCEFDQIALAFDRIEQALGISATTTICSPPYIPEGGKMPLTHTSDRDTSRTR